MELAVIELFLDSGGARFQRAISGILPGILRISDLICAARRAFQNPSAGMRKGAR
ncbi:MAG: hypothetical protein HC767_08520 [Akkermansiaceae bacterium]|nr:hypothetical protein [Akkermansiaceae bacterium]